MLLTEMYRGTLVKDMEFDKLFIIHFVSTLLAMIFACLLAYGGFGLWALMARFAVENVCIGILSFLLVTYRLTFRFNRDMARDFFSFGKFAFASAVLEGGYNNVDRISLGSLVGTAALGFYERAHSIAAYVYTFFWDAVSPVFESLFGNLKDQREKLSQVYNLGSSFFLRIYLVFFIWLGVLIPQIITIIYGEKWLPVVPIFRLLIPFMVLTSLRQFNRTLQLYVGNSKIVAKVQTVEMVSFLMVLFPLIFLFKTNGVALALDMSIVFGVLLFFIYGPQIVDIHLKDIFLMPLLISTLTVAIFYGLGKATRPMNNIYLDVLLGTLIIFATYATLSAILEFRFFRHVYQLVKSKEP